MVPQKIKKKSLVNVNEHTDDALEIINKNTLSPLSENDVFMFKVRLCDNEPDRVFDGMSHEFLVDFCEKASNLTGISNHDWDSDNQLSRLYKTELIVDKTKKNAVGADYEYVVGYAYTLSKFTDYIEKISSGLLRETSVSFDSKGDHCSICGALTTKNNSDIAECPNGHIMGQMYNDKLCYNVLDKLTDVYEWSMVAVPCQKNSGIINKSLLGGSLMKKGTLFLTKFLKSKGLDSEVDVAKINDDRDIDENDVKALVDENVELKAKVKSLEEELENYSSVGDAVAENEELKAKVKSLEEELECTKTKAEADRVDTACKAYVAKLNPLTPVVGENILNEVDKKSLEFDDDGNVTNIEEVFKPVVDKYKGLFKEVEAETKVEETNKSKKSFKPGFTFSDKKVADTKVNKKGLSIN